MPARISFYRPTGQSRRAARSAHDHDVFEGLPVRRWERQWVSVGRPSSTAAPAQPELPLPKDASLLSATSQALLQAARAGSTPNSQADAPKPENTPGAPLFVTKRWVVIPKHMEPPEPVYLAKVPISEEEEQRKKELAAGGEAMIITRKRAPPPPKKKRGRKPGTKKAVFTEGQPQQLEEGEKRDEARDVEMVDAMEVDAATKEEPVPENSVAKEIERQEVVMEVHAVAESKLEQASVAPPVEQPPPPPPAPTPAIAPPVVAPPVGAGASPTPPAPAAQQAPAEPKVE